MPAVLRRSCAESKARKLGRCLQERDDGNLYHQSDDNGHGYQQTDSEGSANRTGCGVGTEELAMGPETEESRTTRILSSASGKTELLLTDIGKGPRTQALGCSKDKNEGGEYPPEKIRPVI